MQGLGAALVTPTTLAIISATFTDPRERTPAVGIWSGVGALALASARCSAACSASTSLGLDLLHQRAGRPGDAGAGCLGDPRIARGRRPRRLDLPGVVTSAVALFALTFALIEGHDRGWTSP